MQEYLEGKGIRIRSVELNYELFVTISIASLPSSGISIVDTSPPDRCPKYETHIVTVDHEA